MTQRALVVDSWVLEPDRLCIFGKDKGYSIIAPCEAVVDIWKSKVILYEPMGVNFGYYCTLPVAPEPSELPWKVIPSPKMRRFE